MDADLTAATRRWEQLLALGGAAAGIRRWMESGSKVKCKWATIHDCVESCAAAL